MIDRRRFVAASLGAGLFGAGIVPSANSSNISDNRGGRTLSSNATPSLQDLWQSLLQKLDSGNVLEYTSLPESRELHLTACKYMFMQLAQAYMIVFHSDGDHPKFLPLVNDVINIAGPNPDAVYYFTSLTPGGIYRISGRRNSVRFVDLQTGYGFWGFPNGPGQTFPSQWLNDFDINADGSFELLMGARKPKGYAGNWMQIDPRADYMMVRQVAYDLATEQDARMAIERIDAVTSKRESTAAEVEQKLHWLTDYFNKVVIAYPRMRHRWAGGKINAYGTAPMDVGTVNAQFYNSGVWQLEPDEALLCEVEVPAECFYWNIQAADLFWQTLEMTYRQSSINGHQAWTDGDGVTRVVIAHQDPGLPNWLDTGGLPQGDMLWRWLRCPAAPAIGVRKVALARLDDYLPKSAKRISAEERREQLRKRALAMQLRRYW